MRGFPRKAVLAMKSHDGGSESEREGMGVKSIRNLEREFDHSYTESISINTGETNPHRKDVLDMVRDRNRSLSLRRVLRMN